MPLRHELLDVQNLPTDIEAFAAADGQHRKIFNKRRKIMLEVNVKQVRSKLGQLLRQVEHGQDILLTKHGKEVACLVPPQKTDRLPSLKEFRQTIATPEQSLSSAVLVSRRTYVL